MTEPAAVTDWLERIAEELLDLSWQIEDLTRLLREARAEAYEHAASVAEAYEPRCESCPRGVAAAIRALIGE